MTSSEKRKDTMLKKKYDKSDMKSMQKQYGKEGKKVYFATIRKQAKMVQQFLCVNVGSRSLPALMTGIGAVGTVMQVPKRSSKDNHRKI